MMLNGRSAIAAQRRKHYERRQVGMGIGRNTAAAHADRSNIQAGTSSQRPASEPLRRQRKTTPSALSIAS